MIVAGIYMTKIKCPTCGAVLVLGGSSTLDQEALCVRLKGTKYLDPTLIPEPGLHWCPDLSDAAPEDVSLLPPGYRAAVEAEIARVGNSA